MDAWKTFLFNTLLYVEGDGDLLYLPCVPSLTLCPIKRDTFSASFSLCLLSGGVP